MKDPERLLRRATGLEQELLSAAAHEHPSPELESRMRHGLGLPVLLASAGAKAAALGWAQATLLAVVTAGLAGSSSSPNYEPAVAPRAVPSIQVPGPRRPSIARHTWESLPAAPAAEAKPNNRQRPPGVVHDVREEVELLDRARGALLRHAPSEALDRLRQYAQRFPTGTLRQEAAVLRIEALREQGEPARAAALARDFLAKHPGSPHAERVMGAAGSSTPAR